MNRSVWTVITCTMLLVIICNFNTMKAAPANNTQVPAKTTPKPAAPSTVKNAAPTTPKPAAPSTIIGLSFQVNFPFYRIPLFSNFTGINV
ncbi:unnamed protein product [Schistosoma bovis]|nr:unnamed protein product [Schistosoma bovis]